jgi:hypothetical protein
MCDNAVKTLGSNHLKHNDRRLHGTDANVCSAENLWRGSLLPLEGVALTRFWGRYAAQREQARSLATKIVFA